MSDGGQASAAVEGRTTARARQSWLGAAWAMLFLHLRGALTWRGGRGLAVGTLAMFAATWVVLDGGLRSSYQTWVIDICLARLFPFLCLITAGRLLREEIKSGTMEYLWTRPAGRARLLLGMFASAACLSFGRGLVIGLAILAAAVWRGTPDVWEGLPLLLLALLGSALSYSGLSLVLAAMSGKYIVLGLIYGLVVEVGISQIPANINAIAASHHVRATLSGDAVWLGLASCLAIGCVAALLGAAVFRWKRYNLGGSGES